MERIELNHLVYRLPIILTLILSNIMCAVIGYNWAFMECGIHYRGYSAPVYTALFSGLPYFIVLLCCIIFTITLRKRMK